MGTSRDEPETANSALIRPPPECRPHSDDAARVRQECPTYRRAPRAFTAHTRPRTGPDPRPDLGHPPGLPEAGKGLSLPLRHSPVPAAEDLSPSEAGPVSPTRAGDLSPAARRARTHSRDLVFSTMGTARGSAGPAEGSRCRRGRRHSGTGGGVLGLRPVRIRRSDLGGWRGRRVAAEGRVGQGTGDPPMRRTGRRLDAGTYLAKTILSGSGSGPGRMSVARPEAAASSRKPPCPPPCAPTST